MRSGILIFSETCKQPPAVSTSKEYSSPSVECFYFINLDRVEVCCFEFRGNSNCLRFTYVVNVSSGIAEIILSLVELLVVVDGETIEALEAAGS